MTNFTIQMGSKSDIRTSIFGTITCLSICDLDHMHYPRGGGWKHVITLVLLCSSSLRTLDYHSQILFRCQSFLRLSNSSYSILCRRRPPSKRRPHSGVPSASREELFSLKIGVWRSAKALAEGWQLSSSAYAAMAVDTAILHRQTERLYSIFEDLLTESSIRLCLSSSSVRSFVFTNSRLWCAGSNTLAFQKSFRNRFSWRFLFVWFFSSLTTHTFSSFIM